ncbi:hypothetical protein CEUSTIGMA_g8583.t1 [Chlamydomonas eustigma]|uniref:Uncharacterized protein n=1 Tax=Chlamydomonas eustigma TaxID=1157962 RepID=A0A250XEF9_9CHLO|nr:hypothetical protein CEUSTIGMA_g8583.t1 [Chlamydomonas eustigma]|eukprot:GAX81150.1 hypothetical protein CEUSTIGMA_g8583.t1 [Chlamydomonas eustigma]
MSVQECTSNMDTSTFHAFTVFFANVHTLCVFVQNQDFERQAEELALRMYSAASAAHLQLSQIQTNLSEQKERLSHLGATLSSIDMQQKSLADIVDQGVREVRVLATSSAKLSSQISATLEISQEVRVMQHELVVELEEAAKKEEDRFKIAEKRWEEMMRQAEELDARQGRYELLQAQLMASSEDLFKQSTAMQGAIDAVIGYEQRSENVLRHIMGRSCSFWDAAWYSAVLGTVLLLGAVPVPGIQSSVPLLLLLIIGTACSERLVGSLVQDWLAVTPDGRQVVTTWSPAIVFHWLKLSLGLRLKTPKESQLQASAAVFMEDTLQEMNTTKQSIGEGNCTADDHNVLQYMEVDYRLMMRRTALMLGLALLAWNLIRDWQKRLREAELHADMKAALKILKAHQESAALSINTALKDSLLQPNGATFLPKRLGLDTSALHLYHDHTIHPLGRVAKAADQMERTCQPGNPRYLIDHDHIDPTIIPDPAPEFYTTSADGIADGNILQLSSINNIPHITQGQQLVDTRPGLVFRTIVPNVDYNQERQAFTAGPSTNKFCDGEVMKDAEEHPSLRNVKQYVLDGQLTCEELHDGSTTVRNELLYGGAYTTAHSVDGATTLKRFRKNKRMHENECGDDDVNPLKR